MIGREAQREAVHFVVNIRRASKTIEDGRVGYSTVGPHSSLSTGHSKTLPRLSAAETKATLFLFFSETTQSESFVMTGPNAQGASQRTEAHGAFSRWARTNRVSFGILLKPGPQSGRDITCLEITQRNLLLHNSLARTHYIEGDCIDSMITSAWLWGYRYLWIQTPGAFITDKLGLHFALEEEMRRGFFVLGHILDCGNSYYSIHRQCLIISLEVWETIGRPLFGDAGAREMTLHVPLRSSDTFYDTHTPKWISGSGGRETFREQRPGWNFVTRGLDHGVRLAPFSPAIRARTGYLYPDEDTAY